MASSEILHVGIDLGTSRSAISASNGERFVVDSFVGWPADMVAKKILKRTVLIGHEAVANRTMLDLHRPLERGLLKEGSDKDVEAVRELLRHLLGLVGATTQRASVVAPVKGVPTELDITNEIKAACETILPPIVETMLDLLSRVEPEFQERVRNNIILSGGGGLIRNLPKVLEDSLRQVGGGKVTYMEDPVFVGSDGGLALALDAPDSDWERLSA